MPTYGDKKRDVSKSSGSHESRSIDATCLAASQRRESEKSGFESSDEEDKKVSRKQRSDGTYQARRQESNEIENQTRAQREALRWDNNWLDNSASWQHELTPQEKREMAIAQAALMQGKQQYYQPYNVNQMSQRPNTGEGRQQELQKKPDKSGYSPVDATFNAYYSGTENR